MRLVNDPLRSSVVISIVRMALADNNLRDGQTQLLLQMGEGPDPESREPIPELIATRWFFPTHWLHQGNAAVMPIKPI
jgi:hypothetical protein